MRSLRNRLYQKALEGNFARLLSINCQLRFFQVEESNDALCWAPFFLPVVCVTGWETARGAA